MLFDLQTASDDVLENSHHSSQHLMALSSDGNVLATADKGREVKFWRLPDCTAQASLVGHVGQLTDILFSTDGRTLFSTSVNSSIKARSVASGRFVMDLRDPQQPRVSYHLR